MTVTVETDADVLREWAAETKERCPVANNLAGSSTLTVDVERA